MKLQLFEDLKNIGCKVTWSYATGTQYEWNYSINNNRKKSTSDIDFQVPEWKLDMVEDILRKNGMEWKWDESGLITIDTFPKFDFCTFFYPLEDKLPTVEIFGTVFETH